MLCEEQRNESFRNMKEKKLLHERKNNSPVGMILSVMIEKTRYSKIKGSLKGAYHEEGCFPFLDLSKIVNQRF